MNTPNTNTTIWCDMDGVIAVYDPDGFRGKNPPFLIKNSHYFQHCKPDTRIIEALRLLQDVYRIRIRIISNVNLTSMSEHHTDKYIWLKQHLPFINVDKYYNTTTISKAETVAAIKNEKLTTSDILISDYNGDLTMWTQCGGTSIKYANGINNPTSHNGIHIPLESNSKEIANQLIDIIYKNNSKGL